MSIRKEEAKDYEIIYSVIKKAFDSTKEMSKIWSMR